MVQQHTCEVASLIVTQSGLREDIKDLVALVEGGVIFDIEELTDYGMRCQGGRISPVIQLSRFEDGLVYIHDGHHRCSAIATAGRKYLYPSEYQLTDWTYKDYYEPAHHNNWYLAFDPRTEVRLPDLSGIKRHIKYLITSGYSAEYVEGFVSLAQHLYKMPRTDAGVYYVEKAFENYAISPRHRDTI